MPRFRSGGRRRCYHRPRWPSTNVRTTEWPAGGPVARRWAEPVETIRHRRCSTMQSPLLEQLVAELVVTDGIMLVMDSAGAVSEMHLREVETPWFDKGWTTIEAAGWHVHINLGAVEGVQFVDLTR